MNPKEGWLDRQYQKAAADVREWPAWMQREGGFKNAESVNNPDVQTESAPQKTKEAKNEE
jgi:hypothetical protein